MDVLAEVVSKVPLFYALALAIVRQAA